MHVRQRAAITNLSIDSHLEGSATGEWLVTVLFPNWPPGKLTALAHRPFADGFAFLTRSPIQHLRPECVGCSATVSAGVYPQSVTATMRVHRRHL